MAAPSPPAPGMMRIYDDGEFIRMSREIYVARSDPAAPPPAAFNLTLFNNLIPDIQTFVARYTPDLHEYVPNPAAHIYLTRNGENGNSLREMAMRYTPSGLTFFLKATPDTSDLMYNFYGNSRLEINTRGQVPIDVNMFHQDVASVSIASSENQDIVLQHVTAKMRSRESLKYWFMTYPSLEKDVSSLRVSSPEELQVMMRTFVQTGFDIMVSSSWPRLSIEVSFSLPFPEERDDSDPHEHLAFLAGQRFKYTSVIDSEYSIVEKPATDTLPARYLDFECYENRATLKIRTRHTNN